MIEPIASISSQQELGTQMPMSQHFGKGPGVNPLPADWASVLDSFETDLRNAEWLLSHGVGEDEILGSGWTPPEGLGPIPAEYCEWVRSLLDRQASMYARLVSATFRSRQRGTYVHAPAATSTNRHSHFIDATA